MTVLRCLVQVLKRQKINEKHLSFVNFIAQKMKFSIEDFFSKCDQIRRKLRIVAGVRKSHLMKIMSPYSGSAGKPKVLILAPTGVAVININGKTINSGLSILLYVNGYTLPRLSDSERARLRNF